VPNTGVIVSFDKGDCFDIHPRDKQTLGYRLAMKAEAMSYGFHHVCDGPIFDGMRIEGSYVRIFFKNVGSGLTTTDGEPPRGFVIGDRAGNLIQAEARIDGDTVVCGFPG